VCAPAGGACVDPDQVAACEGQAENTNCTASAVPIGVCESGVCGNTLWAPTTVIGGHRLPTSVALVNPEGLAVDRAGDLYVADTGNNRIERVDASGVVTTVAGDGVQGDSGDGGEATSAQLINPGGVAVDGLGNVFIADTANHQIRRVDATTGVITSVAGSGSSGFGGDDGPARDATLDYVTSIVLDGPGNLYLADGGANCIRRIDAATGIITTVAGVGRLAGFSGDGGPATGALLSGPSSVAVDAAGNLMIADLFNQRIRRVDAATGIIATIAGNGTSGPAGDGGAAIDAQLDLPFGIAADGAGNVFIADGNNNRIRKVDAGGTITTVAGDGVAGGGGDGGAATSAQLSSPFGVAVDRDGNLYIADVKNSRIREVMAASGIIATVAGNGTSTEDGGAATSSRIESPAGIVADGAGNLYIADAGDNRIRKVDTAGVVTTVAGTGSAGFSGDGGPATSAQLYFPGGLALDGQGGLLVADVLNARIRRIGTDGIITTIAGDGTSSFGGDGGPATAAQLFGPAGVTADSLGTIYIADAHNQRIRRIDTSGIITTVAGNGSADFTGDGGAATSAALDTPDHVALDDHGNLYIVDQGNNRIRRVDVTGVITTIAGGGVGGDGGAATDAFLTSPAQLAIDGAGNLLVADESANRVRRIDAAGIISTVTGTGSMAASGDGGPATSATVDGPDGLAFDAAGNLYVADSRHHSVRRIAANGVITTVAGPIDPDGMGPLAQAQLVDPTAMARAPGFTLFAGGSSGTLQAARTSTAWLGVVAGRYPQSTAIGVLARYRGSSFGTISGVAYDDAAHAIYLTESSAHRLQVVTIVDADDPTTWTIAALANEGGLAGFADGPAQTAAFRAPTGLYFDPGARQLYVADTGNHVIRAIDLSLGVSSATVRTIVGIATDALLFAPQGITRCANGDLFVADTGNHRVRRISADLISTVLGDGSISSAGEGQPATTFPVEAPQGLACDATGNLYVTSTSVVRMVLADATGAIDGSGQVRTIYGKLPHDQFPETVTRCLTDLAVVDSTTVDVIDSCTGIMVELRRQPAQ